MTRRIRRAHELKQIEVTLGSNWANNSRAANSVK